MSTLFSSLHMTALREVIARRMPADSFAEYLTVSSNRVTLTVAELERALIDQAAPASSNFSHLAS